MSLLPTILCHFFLLLMFISCNKDQDCNPFEYVGNTMGSTYSVKGCFSKDIKSVTKDSLIVETEALFKKIDQLMSTYSTDSEIMKFNKGPKDRWYGVSKETAFVINVANKISKMSGGAYDITVKPLVDLWGFGKNKNQIVPTQNDVDRVKKNIGYKNISLRLSPLSVIKKNDSIEIDFSSIAPGFAVDALSKILEKNSIVRYMVEVGGEVKARGLNSRGEKWSIGVEVPSGGERKIQRILQIDNASIATSGSYRNFFEQGGKKYSHTIDPRTGFPVAHDLVSVTVVVPNCIEADGLATMFSVLGLEDGLRLANEKSIAAYFITDEGNQFIERESEKFKMMFGKQDK